MHLHKFLWEDGTYRIAKRDTECDVDDAWVNQASILKQMSQRKPNREQSKSLGTDWNSFEQLSKNV